MKKNLFLTLMLSSFALLSIGQTFEIRTTEGDEGYLYVQMRETSGTGTPQTSDQLSDLVFQIKWLSSLGNVDMGNVICSSYEITKSGTRSVQGGYYYQEYYADNTPFAFPENWTQNIWVTIAKMEVGTGSGTGTFEIGDNAFVPTGVNIGVNLVDYTPTVNGSATDYNFPTIVYDHVWVGGNASVPLYNEKSWALNTNWQTACGDVSAAAPTSASNCLIPGGLTHYPGNVDLFGIFIAAGNNVRIASGGEINAGELASGGLANQLLTFSGDLFVQGSLNIKPDGSVTVLGETFLNSPQSLIVEATATGTGSFIDNGTITYGGSGSAKVQTYLSNAAGAGSFYIHQVGPTVDDEGYTGSGTGADLSAFNVASGSTYAYYWDESEVLSGDNDQGWKNIYSLSYHVETGSGIALSTTDATNHTMEMTGHLITGNVSTPTLAFTQNHYELISNPYPSAIDFDALATANSGVVFAKYWIWDPATGNYLFRNGTTGGSQFVQVGQSFFVETVAGGTFNFTNTNRTHNTVAFRNASENTLHLNVSGGDFGFEDNLYVRFDEVASSGYDVEIESEKWVSRYPDATSISSFTADGTELAINVLPMDYLMNQMSSVPLNFACGYVTGYVFNFDGLETFEVGTEIWLEDKLTGGDWVSLNTQSEYSFTASPDDASDRFVLHFFGPTGTEELASPVIDLYSFGQYAYVRNNTEDIIQELRIYALGGKLVKHIHKVDQKFLKLYVGNETAYYVIVAVTEKEVFTKKIFISK